MDKHTTNSKGYTNQQVSYLMIKATIAAFPDVCFTPPSERGFTATDDLWQ